MLFTEFTFIFYFLPITVAVYALLRDNRQQQMAWVFIASLAFYSAWDWRYTPLLLFSIAANYWFGQKIAEQADRKKAFRWSAAAMAVSLLPLAYFKYSAFIAHTFNFDTGWDGILPLGISFYTFQKIAYIADIYQGKLQPCRNFIRFGFFVTFFPQLIAGPIVHYKYISDQIDLKVDRNAYFGRGVTYFAIGFVKKFFIADHIAQIINPVFKAAGTAVPGLTDSLTATLGYTLQLYFDFSGYSDMAMGLALMFGFTLPVNFNSPYKASSIIDFWRRWHMTLSQFLRDYIYIPLGGNRAGEFGRYRNLMFTMLLGGLWHGAGWTFIAWGGAHGLALVVNHMLNRHIKPNRVLQMLGYPVTFIFVALAWVLFRAENFDTAVNIYKGYLSAPDFVWRDSYLWIIAGSVMIFLPNSHQIVERLGKGLPSCGAYLRGFMETRYFAGLLLAHVLWYPATLAFYETDIDRTLYASLPVAQDVNGIDSTKGDFRSNLFSNRVFTGDEKKIIFAGSSFAKRLDNFNFKIHEQQFKSATLGMSGNNFHVPLRVASQALDTPNLHTLVIATSALNMREIDTTRWHRIHRDQKPYGGAFPYQCMDKLNELGFKFKTDWFGYCEGRKLELYKKLYLFAAFPFGDFYQFRGMLSRYATSFHPEKDASPINIPMTQRAAKEFAKNLQDIRSRLEKDDAKPTGDNGSNDKFKWKSSSRSTIKAISPGGQIYEALKILAKKAKEKGVQLVIYDTPTVTHKDAPFVYPEGFFEEYLAAMKKMTKDIGIKYYDLSDFFPWRKQAMVDFIHPVGELSPLLHQHILYTLYTEGLLK